MKRIIFVTRCFNANFNTGAARIVQDIASALVDLGWDVHLIVGRQTYQDHSDSNPEILKGIHIHRIWNINFAIQSTFRRILNYLFFYVGCIYHLLRLTRPGDVVVATTDPPLISVVVAGVAKMRGARLINWILDIYPELANRLGFSLVRGWRFKVLRSLRNFSWRQASHNLVLGTHMADFVHQQGISKTNLHIYPNWENQEIVYPISLQEAQTVRQSWKMENQFVIGYFGNIGRAHDFETMMESAIHFSKNAMPIKFLFVGYGYYHDYLKETVRENNLSNIVFQPYQFGQQKLLFALGSADVHIISVRPDLEGLLVPLKLYSAMAAGRPIIFIGSQQGEVAMIIKQFDCGSVVDMGDYLNLIKVIATYQNNSALCEKHGSNARKAFENHFNKSVAVRRWHELLESIT